ncbi:DUF6262 family protein [Streptomyces sp. Y1]|uniref:DUF6262 family protein n=1 Tax=Streptomyces sp. Y1 TaxID=3238634 RepID=A0AB39TUY6_9ACTN
MTDARQQRIGRLAEAARLKSEEKVRSAESAIRRPIKRGEAVTFQAVQREASVSHAFLYKNPGLRSKIEYHRSRQRPPKAVPETASTDSNIVLALTAEIARIKKVHREETAALREALEAAHGENLSLRRELARLGIEGPVTR